MQILLISGSLRTASSNAACLRTARQLAPENVSAVFFDLTRELPHYNPDEDHDPLHPAVKELRSALAESAAILFCTPEYAGALPGSFKNVLDWTVGSPDVSGKPVAWVNVSSIAAPTGGADAHESLRKVLGYLNVCIVEEACLRLPLQRTDIGVDGLIANEKLRDQIRHALYALIAATRKVHSPM